MESTVPTPVAGSPDPTQRTGKPRLLVLGASGTGATTLGSAVARALELRFFDADDYFWAPSAPPFQTKRSPEERLRILLADLGADAGFVLSGSICGWGSPLEESFDLIVFLSLPTPIRLERLRYRETELRGSVDPEFIAWAERYDTGDANRRSRAMHERWLGERRGPVLRLDGDLTTARRMDAVMEALRLRRV